MTERGRSVAGTGRDDYATDGRDATRRRFLKATGASAAVGLVGSGSAIAQSASGSFVRTDGTDLVIDGETAYFHGANNFWITDSYRGTQSRIDELFGMFEEMGIDLVRTFASCEGGDGACYMPEPRVHDEAAYENLDYLISAAEDRGIRLVLVLADNWDHNGGVAQYVSWIDGASAHVDFFRNEDVKDLYRWHVEGTLTRTNTVTGREYRDEPAIMAWELCNEPRIEGDDYGDADDPGNERRAQVLEDWIDEMSGYVTDLDPNHLVSTGMEGFYTRPDRTSWFYGDWTGQDYVRHHSIDDVDLCTFHMYPYHWNFPLEYGRTWIREHVRDAHEVVGKPAYCGEFNVNVMDHSLETRNRVLGEWYDAMAAYDCDAATVWQIVTPDMHDHDGFQVYRSQSGDVLNAYRRAVVSKSTAPPITGGQSPELRAPAAVVAETTASSIEAHWSRVAAASEYAVYLDGGADFEVGVAAIGPDGTETATTATTATTVGPSNAGYPQWEHGTVYESGDRVVHNGIVWEAQWYTDAKEPRFESGYAWSFVRVVGQSDAGGPETPTVTERTPTTERPATTRSTTTEGPATSTATTEPATSTTTTESGSTPGRVGSNTALPGDPDGDGLYEDVNGNARRDIADAVDLFRNRESVDPQFFDFTESGGVSIGDAVSLFRENAG